jgi:serine/threonine protein kinase
MPRPLLLIMDGESARTPGLAAALEADGWSVACLHSREAAAFLTRGQAPDLLLLDRAAPGEAYAAADSLRGRFGAIPLLVLTDGTVPPAQNLQRAQVQAFLDLALSDAALATSIRQYRPDSTKLSSMDIFGGLLEELEEMEAHAPVVPPRPTAGRPVAPVQADFLEGLLRETLAGLPQATPELEHLPIPTVTVVQPRLPTSVPESAPVSVPVALGPSDFTFSGISGVQDPFAWVPNLGPETPASTPRSRLEAEGGSGQGSSAVLPGGVLEEYGNYFLIEKIAVGGMAELYKAQQRGVQGFQKIVAIKRILPHFSENEDFVTMFIDEAKLAAQLTHPNIVQIFDLGKAGSSYYIAMEYVNGRDLRTLLKKVRDYGLPFPEQVAAFVVMKVAAALDYAHRKRGFDDRELKLVHRDISPQNVILSAEGAVKLVDFGIAKAATKASHTVAGALKGKLLYMSPEQATGQPLDNRSDLYSLGLVLFELLTGERCFQADSELGVLEKVRLGRITDITRLNPNLSKDMLAIVNRALQKGVDHRYPSARFMERDLREYLQRQGTTLTEHDVAEYMQALLGDSREVLEHLVATRFPTPISLASGVHPVLGSFVEPEASGVREENTLALVPEPAPTSKPEPVPARPARPRWLLPLILTLAVILVIMLVVARWS